MFGTSAINVGRTAARRLADSESTCLENILLFNKGLFYNRHESQMLVNFV